MIVLLAFLPAGPMNVAHDVPPFGHAPHQLPRMVFVAIVLDFHVHLAGFMSRQERRSDED